MKITIVGTGMGGSSTLTAEGRSAIEQSPLLIGAARMLEPYASSGKELFSCYDTESIISKITSSGLDAAVLMSGDCGFFSGAERLRQRLAPLEGIECRTVCGIATPVYMSAALGIPWEKMKLMSLHGHSSGIAVNVRLNEYCFFLLGSVTAGELCQRLESFSLGSCEVTVGERLGYEDERFTSAAASELSGREFSPLSAVIVRNPSPLTCVPSQINDSDFERSSVPMTKAEVRALAVSALQVSKNSTCWDVGSGTGSVSVELAFACPEGTVCAFDKAPEAAELTRRNALRFGCDNIIAVEGSCPECLNDAPAPDKVFVGGSSGSLEGIFGAVYQKNPSADIVVTAVSLETLSQARECFGKYGCRCSVMQVSVTRTRSVGSHTMLDALNPVFVIRGRLS